MSTMVQLYTAHGKTVTMSITEHINSPGKSSLEQLPTELLRKIIVFVTLPNYTPGHSKYPGKTTFHLPFYYRG
jgi:hypothetical protein